VRASLLVASVTLAAIATAAAIVYYVQVRPLANAPESRAAPAQSEHAGDMPSLATRLAQRLERAPGDAEGWVLLGKTYQQMGNFAGAADALRRAAALLPGDAGVLADLVDVLVVVSGRRWTEEARSTLAAALRADPAHWKALWLAGTEAFDRHDYRGALAHWEKLANNAAPGSEMRSQVESSIAEARALLGEKPAAPREAAKAAAGAITGTVELSPALRGRYEPADTLFVLARAPSGPPMPLAVQRFRAGELPVRFRLDENSSMVPGRVLAEAGEVSIVARISRSGSPQAQPGDLEGRSGPVRAGAKVRIVIDRAIER